MKKIEAFLLNQIITDYEFAQYITQRIDIGDFNDPLANKIYDRIVELLFQEKQITFEVLMQDFSENREIVAVIMQTSTLTGQDI